MKSMLEWNPCFAEFDVLDRLCFVCYLYRFKIAPVHESIMYECVSAKFKENWKNCLTVKFNSTFCVWCIIRITGAFITQIFFKVSEMWELSFFSLKKLSKVFLFWRHIVSLQEEFYVSFYSCPNVFLEIKNGAKSTKHKYDKDVISNLQVRSLYIYMYIRII